MTSYNSQKTLHKFSIQYETDSYENYIEVQKLIRKQIDKEQTLSLALSEFTDGGGQPVKKSTKAFELSV